jgi:ATP-binding cassette subfamily B protein
MSESPPVSPLAAARAMLAIAWRADPVRAVVTAAAVALQAVFGSLFALWLALLVNGVQAHRSIEVVSATALVALSIAAAAGLDALANRLRAAFNDQVQHLVQRTLLETVARTPTLDLQENPEHVLQIELLEDEGWEFGQVIPSLVDLLSVGVRSVIAAVLLLSVSPLLLLLPLFGLPALLLSPVTGDLFPKGGELAGEPARHAMDLFELATGAPGAKEVRTFRLADEVLRRFHRARDQVRRIYVRLAWRNGLLGLGAQLVFVAGYIGAISISVVLVDRHRVGVGAVVLTAVLAGQVLGLVTGSASMLQWAGRTLRAAGRYLRIVRVAEAARAQVDRELPPPAGLRSGIRLERVSYRYPGATSDALQEVDLDLPVGSVVAVVGENGAGKTTLVKLLSQLQRPTSGRILVDGVDLNRFDPDEWRLRLSAAFQDHGRFEFVLQEAVGVGWLPNLESPTHVRGALDRAAAGDLLSGLPNGAATQLGPAWPGGVDLSGGQWQKVALARAMMRDAPLVLLLDEPASALDAGAERLLFESWMTSARRLGRSVGAITILISHRLATVRRADRILVLADGRLVEQGDHSELLRLDGIYAELFRLQAAAYR